MSAFLPYRLAVIAGILLSIMSPAHQAAAQFVVTDVTPGINAADAPASPVFRITFSHAAEAGTINDSTIVIHGRHSGRWRPAEVAFDAATRSARLSGGRAFAPGEQVFVIATGRIESVAGEALQPFGWSFTVGSDGGSGVFTLSATLPVDSDFWSMQPGDFDGDGHSDLALAVGYGELQLFLASGNGSFTPGPMIIKNSYNPIESLAAGDFNGDGRLDIVAMSGSGDVRATIYFNEGGGVFRAGPALSAGDGAYRALPADFNGDGHLDLGFNSGHLYVSDGAGGFEHRPAALPATAWQVADLDNDGSLDIVTLEGVRVYMNDGSGNYTEVYDNPDRGMPYLIHIDGDGFLDLLIVRDYYAGDNIEFLLNDRTGRFTTLRKRASIGNAHLSGDLDGDGDVDIVWFTSGGVTSLLNDGSGNYREQRSTFPTVGAPTWGVLNDVDGNGVLDLVLAYPYSGFFRGVAVAMNRPAVRLSAEDVRMDPVPPGSSDQRNVALYNHSASDLRVIGLSTKNSAFSAATPAGTIAAHDSAVVTITFTPDGGVIYADTLRIRTDDTAFPELALALHGRGIPVAGVLPARNALVLEVRPDIEITFTFDIPAPRDDALLLDGSLSGSRSATRLAFDGGARTATYRPDAPFHYGEVVTATFSPDRASFSGATAPYQWQFRIGAASGDGVFAIVETQTVGSYPWSIAAGDLDGDGHLDLATGSAEMHQVLLHWNDGRGRFSDRDTLLAGGGMSVDLVDFDRDHDLDVVVGIRRDDGWGTKLASNEGQRTFRREGTVFPDRIHALTDVNGDGLADAITTGTGLSIDLHLNEEGDTFRHVSTMLGTNVGLVPAVGDFDGDGVPDVGLSDQSRFALYKGLGDGYFRLHSTVTVWYSLTSVVTADFDGDGDLDIVGSLAGGYSVAHLVNRGDGRFDLKTIDTERRSTGAISAADYDADGHLDLAVAINDGSMIWTFLNDGSGSFWKSSSLQLPRAAYDLATGDFDGDGDLDLAAVDAVSHRLFLLDNRYQPPVRLIATPDTVFARNSGPHLLVADVRDVFSDRSGSPWVEYSVGGTTESVLPELAFGHAITIDLEDDYHGRANVFLTATNASGSVTDIVEITVLPPIDPPVFSASFPDTMRLVAGRPYALELWELVEDATTADSELTFDFQSAPEALELAFDESIGRLYVTAKKVVENARLRISATDSDGEIARRTISLLVLESTATEYAGALPQQHQLGVNYPNPVRAVTTIELGLSRDSELLLEIYSVLGRRVALLYQGYARAGHHAFSFDATGVPPGMYVCRMRTGDGFAQSRPLIVVR